MRPRGHVREMGHEMWKWERRMGFLIPRGYGEAARRGGVGTRAIVVGKVKGTQASGLNLRGRGQGRGAPGPSLAFSTSPRVGGGGGPGVLAYLHFKKGGPGFFCPLHFKRSDLSIPLWWGLDLHWGRIPTNSSKETTITKSSDAHCGWAIETEVYV